LRRPSRSIYACARPKAMPPRQSSAMAGHDTQFGLFVGGPQQVSNVDQFAQQGVKLRPL